MESDLILQEVKAKEKLLYYMQDYIINTESKVEKIIATILSVCAAAFVYGVTQNQTIVLYFVNFICLFIVAYILGLNASFLIMAAFVWHLEKELNEHYNKEIYIWNSKLIPKYRRSTLETSKTILMGGFIIAVFGASFFILLNEMKSVALESFMWWVNIIYLIVCIAIIVTIIIGCFETRNLKLRILKDLGGEYEQIKT